MTIELLKQHRYDYAGLRLQRRLVVHTVSIGDKNHGLAGITALLAGTRWQAADHLLQCESA